MKSILFTLTAFISFGLSYGQFGAQQVISTEIESPRFLTPTDINEDGITDLMYVGEGNKLYWLQGLNNDAEFDSAEILYDTGNSYWQIKLFDIDNDGLEDIVFVHGGNHNITVIKKIDANGTYATQQLLISNTNLFINNFQILDIDEDADYDLVTFSIVGNSLNSSINSYENINNSLVFDN